VTTTIHTSPVSDDGQLLHAEDAAAQACLAVLRLEDALARHGRRPRLLRLELRAADAAVLDDVVGIVRERLTCAEVPLHVSTVARLDPPGALVGLWAEVDAADQAGPCTEPTTHPEGQLMSIPLTASRPAALAALPGVLFPGDAGFDDARRPWNLAVDLQPAAVGVPRTVEEAVAIVAAASHDALRVSPLSTGHLALSLHEVDLAGTVLLRLSELTGVTIDHSARTARVLGGTVWQDVADAAAPYGLAALHGSAGDVAVAGYILGGGLSFYGRAHGLATGTVRALEVVTAGGEVIRATADDNAELFWGLRGGGGGLGVVVALEIDLLPIDDVYAGMLLWDLSRGPEVLRAWARWSATAPESATTSLRFLRFPPIPELPPFLSGRRLVVIDGAILDDDDRAAEILAPLRALGPEIDTFGRIPATGVLGIHMDPPAPTPGVSDHVLLADLPEEAIRALLAAAGPDVDTPLMVAELRQLGGALARPIDAALPLLQGRFALFTLAAVPVPALFDQAMTAAKDAAAALRPWSSGVVYPNFTERRSEASAFFDAETRGRLARLRAEWDPTGLWLAAHDI
jgi:FAD/FMN-containing dehydrogenase